jgi:hypothetical protein
MLLRGPEEFAGDQDAMSLVAAAVIWKFHATLPRLHATQFQASPSSLPPNSVDILQRQRTVS